MSFVARRMMPQVVGLSTRRFAQQQSPSVRGFKTLATSQAQAIGGREGRVTSKDGQINMNLVKQEGLGGKPGQTGTNPEQLFAAGYAACFRGAMGVAQGKLGLPAIPENCTVEGIVDLGKHDNGTLGIAAELRVAIPGWSQGDIQKLIEEAHQICPYSHATRNNVNVKLTAV